MEKSNNFKYLVIQFVKEETENRVSETIFNYRNCERYMVSSKHSGDSKMITCKDIYWKKLENMDIYHLLRFFYTGVAYCILNTRGSVVPITTFLKSLIPITSSMSSFRIHDLFCLPRFRYLGTRPSPEVHFYCLEPTRVSLIYLQSFRPMTTRLLSKWRSKHLFGSMSSFSTPNATHD